ncbi:hypothetical protein GmHk_08G021833 [Glycine max]|nr:hypothetical protein GmHk_08G021833 [Glycine max]
MESLRHSERSTGCAGSHMKWRRSCASQRWVVAKPKARPGHTLRPAPKGASLKSDPMIETSSLRNLSGLKAHGSSQMDESCDMAHMLTIAVVPAGTRTLSTWTSLTARRAHDRSGPGGCSRRTSFTIAWRYGRFAISESRT